MAEPRKLTRAQIEQNKKKQQALRDAGINVRIDGSWGPWQEEQYRKISVNRAGKPRQANAAVLALPTAGYGIAQLLEGIGAASSVSLPSISLPSAPALAMAAPLALTLAGPAYGLYEAITGQHHGSVRMSPEERQANTFAADATRVNRPIAISPIPRTQARLQGEAFVNPALARSRAVSMASEAAQDSTATAPRDSTATAPTPPPSNPDNKDKKKKKGKSNWLWEGSGNSAPRNPNLGRNFRNWGIRVPLYTGAGAVAVDVGGNVIGAASEPDSVNHQWKWPLTNLRFTPERGIWKLVGDSYRTAPGAVPAQGGGQGGGQVAPSGGAAVPTSSDSAVVVPISSAPVEQRRDFQSVADSINALF